MRERPSPPSSARMASPARPPPACSMSMPIPVPLSQRRGLLSRLGARFGFRRRFPRNSAPAPQLPLPSNPQLLSRPALEGRARVLPRGVAITPVSRSVSRSVSRDERASVPESTHHKRDEGAHVEAAHVEDAASTISDAVSGDAGSGDAASGDDEETGRAESYGAESVRAVGSVHVWRGDVRDVCLDAIAGAIVEISSEDEEESFADGVAARPQPSRAEGPGASTSEMLKSAMSYDSTIRSDRQSVSSTPPSPTKLEQVPQPGQEQEDPLASKRLQNGARSESQKSPWMNDIDYDSSDKERLSEATFSDNDEEEDERPMSLRWLHGLKREPSALATEPDRKVCMAEDDFISFQCDDKMGAGSNSVAAFFRGNSMRSRGTPNGRVAVEFDEFSYFNGDKMSNGVLAAIQAIQADGVPSADACRVTSARSTNSKDSKEIKSWRKRVRVLSKFL